MIHKVYIYQLVSLVGIGISSIILIYSLFKSSKRDKIRVLLILAICSFFYLFATLKINYHNRKASVFFGNHKLVNYYNKNNCSIEILDDQTYKIYNRNGILNKGKWELIVVRGETKALLINGEVLGVGVLKITKVIPNNKKVP